MRNASGTLRVMFTLVLLVAAQVVVALWRATPEIVDTGRAMYHAVVGACRHTFVANQTEAISITALALVVGVMIVLIRLARSLSHRSRRTRDHVRRLLDARMASWPADVTAAALRLGLTGHVDVIEHPAPIAFCHGFLRPRICLSSGLARLLTPRELDAVLLHEEHHRRRHDPLLLLVTGALAHALAFIPTLRDMQLRYDAVKEFEADAAAVDRLGGPGPMAGALYRVLTSPVAGPELTAVVVGGLSVTERRIDHLVAPRVDDLPGLSRRRLALSGLIVGALSLPALALTVATIEPIVHSCRF